jgi:hypothetical protein
MALTVTGLHASLGRLAPKSRGLVFPQGEGLQRPIETGMIISAQEVETTLRLLTNNIYLEKIHNRRLPLP